MSNTEKITGLSPGDYKQISCIMRGLAADVVINSAIMYVMRNKGDGLAKSIFTQTITTVSSANGHITLVGGGTPPNRIAKMTFVWTSAQTNLFLADVAYFFAIKVTSLSYPNPLTAGQGYIVIDGVKP